MCVSTRFFSIAKHIGWWLAGQKANTAKMRIETRNRRLVIHLFDVLFRFLLILLFLFFFIVILIFLLCVCGGPRPARNGRTNQTHKIYIFFSSWLMIRWEQQTRHTHTKLCMFGMWWATAGEVWSRRNSSWQRTSNNGSLAHSLRLLSRKKKPK